jgi:hypothetical protein
VARPEIMPGRRLEALRGWQRRFMEAGVDGLLHDKTRKAGKAPVPEPLVAQ